LVERVLLGFSGGVDSTMACLELLQSGYDVVPVTLFFKGFHSEANIKKARMVAEALGVKNKHLVYESKELFKREVLCDFLGNYEKGFTPNPCVICNERVKFKVLMEIANTEGCNKIATGHYARISTASRDVKLCRGIDPAKDQSYMLYRLPKTFYSYLLFPNGTKTKYERLEKALQVFPDITKGMKENEDLCFLKKGELYNFLEKNINSTKRGAIVSVSGEILGRHNGIYKYTIGQRQGLGLAGGPWYVVDKRKDENVIVVGRKEDLSANVIYCSNAVMHEKIIDGTLLAFKHRYRAKPTMGIFFNINKKGFMIKPIKPVYSVAPGQSLVLYSGSRVVGGGIIEKSVRGNKND